jgi:hypothetical protein
VKTAECVKIPLSRPTMNRATDAEMLDAEMTRSISKMMQQKLLQPRPDLLPLPQTRGVYIVDESVKIGMCTMRKSLERATVLQANYFLALPIPGKCFTHLTTESHCWKRPPRL